MQRRELLRGVCALAAVGGAGCTARSGGDARTCSGRGPGSDSAGERWPEFRYDGNTGYAAGVGAPSTVDEVRWQFRGNVRVSPAVSDGKVYVTTDEGLHALDATEGCVRWRVKDVDGTFSTPAVDGGTVYHGGRGGVYAFGAGDGTTDWQYEVPADPGRAGTPAVGDDAVYVVTERTKSVASDGGISSYRVVALSMDGSAQWRWKSDSRQGIVGPPVVGDGTVYATVQGGDLVAIDAADGSERWHFDRPGLGRVAVADGTVYAGGKGTLWALSPGGEVRWTYEVDAGGGESPGLSAPAVTDGSLYVGTDAGVVHAVDLQTGEGRWNWQVGTSMSAPPVVAGDTVLAGGAALEDDRSVLVALDRSGEKRWRFTETGGRFRTPAVAGGVVFASLAHRSLLAIA